MNSVLNFGCVQEPLANQSKEMEKSKSILCFCRSLSFCTFALATLIHTYGHNTITKALKLILNRTIIKFWLQLGWGV